jgi:hypothetical protein
VVFIHNEVLLSHEELSKWMELENITLSEVSQAQKTKNHMFSSYVDIRPRESTAMLLDLGSMLRGEHILEEWG